MHQKCTTVKDGSFGGNTHYYNTYARVTHILLPKIEPVQRRLVFYLAMEEFVAEHLDTLLPENEEGAFFLWQSNPTVIIGKNQDVEAEVNLRWCAEHGVDVCRRKSGGGCVYSDKGNQMISFVMRERNAQEAFAYYLNRLVETLSLLGLPAVSSTHNDVMIGDKKVSGNACFAGKKATIVHGTLLWKSNMDDLTAAITPSEAKLAKHAVQSVRQRVTNLYEWGITDLSALQQHLIANFSLPNRQTVTLTSADIDQIEQIEKTYIV